MHAAVKCCLPQVLDLILKRNPMLSYPEDVTGRTPLEVVEDAYLAERFANSPTWPELEDQDWPRGHWISIVDRVPKSFVKQKKDKRSA